MNIEAELQALEAKLDPLDRIVRLLTASLDAPRMHRSISGQGFRYDGPGVTHLCLIKGVRAISAFNASLELARKGYMQEIAVLMRTLVECTTHIEFVLERFRDDAHRQVGSGLCTALFRRQ